MSSLDQILKFDKDPSSSISLIKITAPEPVFAKELAEVVLAELEALQAMLPEEAIRIDLDDLHLTLVHQSILKPFEEQLKEVDFPEPPLIDLDDEVFERTSPGKKSWAVRVVNQDQMREYVKEVMASLGSENLDPEPERRFHISLANLTGNPHDSVR